MSKHEIRLRRHRMTSSGVDRYRNYGTVLKRHEQNVRLKKIMKAFTFLAIILILIMIITMLNWWENQSKDGLENNILPSTDSVTHSWHSNFKDPFSTFG